MLYHERYPKETPPTIAEMGDYIGTGKELWEQLLSTMLREYKIKPKVTYSCCSGKPGWNVKLLKSGKSFGTFYPEEGGFSVFLVVADKLEGPMQSILPRLEPRITELYTHAENYMKIGKWIMFRIDTARGLDDYFQIAAVKQLG